MDITIDFGSIIEGSNPSGSAKLRKQPADWLVVFMALRQYLVD